jgi:integrase
LTAAVDRGYVRKNVAKQVTLPRPVRKDIHPLAPEAVTRFLGALRGDRLFALYVVAIDSGAREGELLALEWSDWDPETRELNIRRTLVEHKGTRFTRHPKSKASRRKILLSGASAAALEAHRQTCDGRLIFPNPEGSLYASSGFIRYTFRPARSRAGFPDLRFHDLRHTCATLLLMNGVDAKTVAERLGHANVQTTMRTYAHVLPAMRQKAAAVLGAYLNDCTDAGGSK